MCFVKYESKFHIFRIFNRSLPNLLCLWYILMLLPAVRWYSIFLHNNNNNNNNIKHNNKLISHTLFFVVWCNFISDNVRSMQFSYNDMMLHPVWQFTFSQWDEMVLQTSPPHTFQLRNCECLFVHWHSGSPPYCVCSVIWEESRVVGKPCWFFLALPCKIPPRRPDGLSRVCIWG